MTQPPGRFFLPGPTEVYPEILDAMRSEMIPHRGVEMTDLLAGMVAGLQDLFQTKNRVFIGTCSATGFMEMAVRCGVTRRVLCLVSGAFGARFAALADACGHDVVRLQVALGKVVEPDMLRDALQRSRVDAVTVVHSETATGVLAPVLDLARVVREFDGVQLFVDAVTSIGGLPVRTDDWGLDFVLTGSQKALALPPGLALGVASEKLVKRARDVPDRGGYLDVVTFAESVAKNQPTNTPAIPLLFALARQLARIDAEGGVESRWARHEAMYQRVVEWVDTRGREHGLGFLPAAPYRSRTVSCLTVPEDINGRVVVRRLRETGWVIGTGYGDLKESTIRIGHMGDHTVAELNDLLDALDEVMTAGDLRAPSPSRPSGS